MKRLVLSEIIEAVGGGTNSTPPTISVSGVSIDSRTTRSGELFFAILGKRFDGHDFVAAAQAAGACAAVVSRREMLCDSPADSMPLILVKDTIEALGRLAAYHRQQHSAIVVAVTGSNGKTTTREMIHHALAGNQRGTQAPASYNNQIGVPLSLLSVRPDDRFVVLELGTNQRGEIAALARLARPDIGVLTSIGPAHLEGLEDRAGVAHEKCALFEHLTAHGLAVINADHPEVDRYRPDRPTYRTVRFGQSSNADVQLTDYSQEADGIRFTYNKRFEVRVPVLGRHNALNALAAIIVGRRFGLSDRELAERLATFAPPPLRLQPVRVGAVDLLFDAYNANPDSMAAALDVFDAVRAPRRRVLVLGDMAEQGRHAEAHHRELGQRVARSKADVLIAVGAHARTVAGEFPADRISHVCKNVEGLIGSIARWIAPGDLLLVKGSRLMQLERIVPAIEKAGAAPAAARG